jgi:hypothetical protein
MRTRLTGICVTVLAAATMLTLMTTYSPTGIARTLDLTPTAYNYLPLVVRQPTPTPTATPKPTATTSPTLRDGHYLADLADYSEHAQGEIWFTVAGEGTEVNDAGFLFRVSYYACSWVGYSWAEPVAIDNGEFRFWITDGRSYYGWLECNALSSKAAFCSASYPAENMICGGAEGVAALQ